MSRANYQDLRRDVLAVARALPPGWLFTADYVRRELPEPRQITTVVVILNRLVHEGLAEQEGGRYRLTWRDDG
jgi:hypothetical protein